MKKEWKFISFDLGAESGRCIVVRFRNGKINLEQVHRFTTTTIRTAKEFHWDILAVFEEIVFGLSKSADMFGPDFDGIAIDTWGVDYALIDSSGNLLGLPFHYRDDRTDGLVEKAFGILPKETLYSVTGNQPAQYNTLFQLLAEKEKKPGLLSTANKLLLTPDFLTFLLTGNKTTEYTIASTTNLTNPVTRNWDWNLIDRFGLPATIFPNIVEPGNVSGYLHKLIAERTGLSLTIPVISTAEHDTASAVAAIPANCNNWAFLSSGTWSLMGVELDRPILNATALNYGFTNEGGVNKTARFLKNIIGLWPIQECRRSWLTEDENYSYSELAILADKEGPVNVWIDLNDSRFLKQGNMPQKVCAFLAETDQIVKNEPGFIIRTVLESLAFLYRKTLLQIEELTGKKIDVLHIVGGGIQNELLTQFTADATGKTVIAGPIEGAVAGNAGVQAITAGAAPDIHAWRQIVANSFELKTYTPRDTKYYDDNESNYNKILKT